MSLLSTPEYTPRPVGFDLNPLDKAYTETCRNSLDGTIVLGAISLAVGTGSWAVGQLLELLLEKDLA